MTIPEGWTAPAPLAEMVGRPILYRNKLDVIFEARLAGIDEGWAIIEFRRIGLRIVRPSRIIAYREQPNA